MSDNPVDDATLNNLGAVENPGPYVYITRTGRKKVTFPDPGNMDWTEAEDLLKTITTKPDTEALQAWLSEADYQTFVAEKMTMRQKNGVLLAVFRHYSDIFGTLGEESASDG